MLFCLNEFFSGFIVGMEFVFSTFFFSDIFEDSLILQIFIKDISTTNFLFSNFDKFIIEPSKISIALISLFCSVSLDCSITFSKLFSSSINDCVLDAFTTIRFLKCSTKPSKKSFSSKPLSEISLKLRIALLSSAFNKKSESSI